MASAPSPGEKAGPTTLHISDRTALAAAWAGPHAILTHLNADTTWVLHLPYPPGAPRPPGRSRLNVLLDPWLTGSQSDGGRWFSIQWHVVAPSVQTIAELNGLLAGLERAAAVTAAAPPPHDDGADGDGGDGGDSCYVDVVAVSHEFTDHCHEATLRELPGSTPVFAPDKAARLIRSWRHFDSVIETPALTLPAAGAGGWREALRCAPLPPWLGIGRVVTPGNALYYHAALVVAWTGPAEGGNGGGDAVVYSPHGVGPDALAGLRGAGLRVLALLHGLDDIRLWMTKQLNLGAVNGVAAARACGAKYWVATHDEVKKGGGFVSLLLRRTRWSVAEAVKREGQKSIVTGADDDDDERETRYEFVELGSGDGLVLA
ncbi:hypothetical protein F4802DRAFT_566819 [Xylaria palmicola]|nr:hypothetical protein F4802DRAFT_566819 [Xylaria palmicola]